MQSIAMVEQRKQVVHGPGPARSSSASSATRQSEGPPSRALHDFARINVDAGVHTALPGVIQRKPAKKDTPKREPTPEQLCGAGEMEGNVQICCTPQNHPEVPECEDEFEDVLFKCWDKQPPSEHLLDVCGGQARFALCRCLARRLGPQWCKCQGLV
jgi:hypothetical protein